MTRKIPFASLFTVVALSALAGCVDGKYLAHDLLVGAKVNECYDLPGPAQEDCFARHKVSYEETQRQLEEIRRDRNREDEAVPGLEDTDRF